MSAAEAHRVGMVNRVVPVHELVAATLELAQHISKNPALGLKLVKRAVNRTMDYQGLTKSLEYAFLLHVFSKATEEYQQKMWKPLVDQVNKEGLKAFLKARDGEF